MARVALTPAREGFSFITALSGFSDAQLLTLLRVRPDLANPPPKDLAVLAARAASWSSIDAYMVTLSQPCKQLLDALCLLAQPTTVTALTRLLATEVHAAELDAALKRLADAALIFRKGHELRLHPQIQALPNPAGLGPPLSTALATQQASVLEAVARRFGAKPGRTKVETTATLTTILQDPDQLQRALGGAPAGTAAIATRLAEHGVGTVPSGTYHIRPESPLGWLGERGFVFATDWDTIVMPREVGLALRGGRPFPDFGLSPPAIRWSPVDADSVERASVEEALRVVADIATILDNWESAPPKLLKAGGLGIRDTRKAAQLVGRSETETARLIELAAIAGLAGWDNETATAAPCPAYDLWLELGVAERWMGLVSSWLAVDLQVNLAGATGSNGKPIPPLLVPWSQQPARHRRKLVLAALLEGDPGQCADIDTLVARVTWQAPALWAGGPALPPTLISWVREEASMLGICASGTLSALGRAVVTGRIDEAGAVLAAHAPKITSEFVIQADLTAVATGPLATSTRADLELMADLESSGAATVYRFSDQSLRRAYDVGRTSAEIMEFLDARATKGVPQPLAYLVDDVGRRHGRVRVGSATCYVRSDDQSLLAEILVARKATKLGLRQLAPTVLVSAADAETVVATLRAGGYLPAEEDGFGALLVRRREVGRATEGHGPLSAWAFDAPTGQLARDRAAELTHMLAHPDSVVSFSPTAAGGRGHPNGEQDLKKLVRRLRSPGPSAGSGPQPPGPRSPSDNGVGTQGATRTPAPISQLKLLRGDPERPGEIARSRLAIVELLELSHEYGWVLRLEYASQRGQSQLLSVTVFRMDGAQVVVGTLPGYGTRILTISGISWARALTEGEEKAL